MWALLLRFAPQIGIALAIIGAVFYIDHRGYERAQAAELARESRITAAITKAVSDIDAKTAARIAAIDTTQRTIVQPILTREISSAPRFSDPAAGITDGMRSALNTARGASATLGGNQPGVPAGTPASR